MPKAKAADREKEKQDAPTQGAATRETKGLAGSSGAAAKKGVQKKKRFFTKEISNMMYGFGDVPNPLPASVDLVEDLVLEFISEMTHKAMQVSRKRGKIATEDLVFLIRKDRKKYARVVELLRMHEELKQARKLMDVKQIDQSHAAPDDFL